MIPTFELIRIARQMTERFDCLLFGSLGLDMTYPEVLMEGVHDADFYADCTMDNLKAIIAYLKGEGYQVQSWQDPIDDKFDYEKMRGRFYFRAIKEVKDYEPAVVDVTYEIRDITYAELSRLTIIQDGVRVLNKEGFLMALSKAERQKHKEEWGRLHALTY